MKTKLRRLGVQVSIVVALIATCSVFLLCRNRSNSVDTAPAISKAEVLLPDPVKEQSNERKRRMKQMLSKANAEVVFYGKVVDEDGQPLPQVHISYFLQTNNAETIFGRKNPLVSRHGTVSGADGNFTIENHIATLLAIKAMRKAGYQFLPPPVSSFTYALYSDIHYPSKDHPVMFYMCEARAETNLIQFDYRILFEWDEKTYRYSLETGRRDENGDLIIRPMRRGWETDGLNFEWYAEVSIADGSVKGTGEKPVYLAPPDGYAASVAFGRGYNERSVIQTKGDFWIFTRTSGGIHSLIKLCMYPDQQPRDKFSCSVDITRNKDGSRLLAKPQ